MATAGQQMQRDQKATHDLMGEGRHAVGAADA